MSKMIRASYRIRLAALSAVAATIASCATPTRKAGADVSLAKLHAPFVGRWEGTLEYRDYTTNERTVLPTRVSIRDVASGASLGKESLFDEGGGRWVGDSSTVTFDLSAGTCTFSGDDYRTVLRVDGLTRFAERGGGVLVMRGEVEENGQPAKERLTVTATAGALVFEKETGPDENSLQFRNRLTLQRAQGGEGESGAGH